MIKYFSKDRQIFIKAKYVEKKYVMVLPPASSTSQGHRLRRWTVSKRKSKKPTAQVSDVSRCYVCTQLLLWRFLLFQDEQDVGDVTDASSGE